MNNNRSSTIYCYNLNSYHRYTFKLPSLTVIWLISHLLILLQKALSLDRIPTIHSAKKTNNMKSPTSQAEVQSPVTPIYGQETTAIAPASTHCLSKPCGTSWELGAFTHREQTRSISSVNFSALRLEWKVDNYIVAFKHYLWPCAMSLVAKVANLM